MLIAFSSCNPVGKADFGIATNAANAVAPLITFNGATGTNGAIGAAMLVAPTILSTNGSPLLSCTTSPTLPSGLIIDSSSCVISGTPTAILMATVYTVTATNSAGLSTANVSLLVDANTPLISYAGSTGTSGTTGAAMLITPSTFNNQGAAITTCLISPALPSGLN